MKPLEVTGDCQMPCLQRIAEGVCRNAATVTRPTPEAHDSEAPEPAGGTPAQDALERSDELALPGYRQA